jgi:hypothetical protein
MIEGPMSAADVRGVPDRARDVRLGARCRVGEVVAERQI